MEGIPGEYKKGNLNKRKREKEGNKKVHDSLKKYQSQSCLRNPTSMREYWEKGILILQNWELSDKCQRNMSKQKVETKDY